MGWVLYVVVDKILVIVLIFFEGIDIYESI